MNWLAWLIEGSSQMRAATRAYQQALDGQRIAYQAGRAVGEQEGRAQAFAEIERVVNERRGFEVLQSDVDLVRKLH